MASTPQLYVSPPAEHAHRTGRIRQQLHASRLPEDGLDGLESHLTDITSGIIRNCAPTYFGFVVGAVVPPAAYADRLVTEIDANVGVHLPQDSVAIDIEDTALRWLLDLFRLDSEDWNHRIFTSGATASNILGLAIGREYVVAEAARRQSVDGVTVGELGLVGALKAVSKESIQILTPMGHSSVSKAASIVGLGRAAVVDVSDANRPVRLDWPLLIKQLEREDVLNIVCLSFGEVNTGMFSTEGLDDMRKLRELCDKHGAYIHADGGRSLNGQRMSLC
jgi:glutamate/tyrosine decarboxylase-like PLP-dependent enzyme